jgi:fused signal recognition particle receptor
MFGLGKKQKTAKQAIVANSADTADLSQTINPADESTESGLFARLKQGLNKTRSRLSEGISSLVLGEKTIDSDLLEEIETQLLSADVGIEASNQIISRLKQRLDRKQLSEPAEFMQGLKQELTQILQPCDIPLTLDTEDKPFVILMVGVNGVGKTTTAGKLATQFKAQGRSVMLAAGDTFRAAAVEQLQVWGERNNVPVIAQASGADSASVIFDAYKSAQAKQIDVLIADTAGRLHTKDNLMNELEKIVRVLKKQDDRLPDETMLVLDATTGQNALIQAESFHNCIRLSGLALTKLDGTAKGGVVFAIAKRLGLPIRFIGVGEQGDDLKPFAAATFVDALFAE